MNNRVSHNRTAVVRLPIRTSYAEGSWKAQYKRAGHPAVISEACFSEQEAIESMERRLLGYFFAEVAVEATKRVAKKPAMRQKA